MATFTQGFIPNTSPDGTSLIITDTSVYGGLLPKSAFTSRTVLITKTDNTIQTVDFPYAGTPDNVQDVLTVIGFFDKDYYISIRITWEFINETVPSTAILNLDYLSHYKALICFVDVSDKTDCDSCSDDESMILNKLSNYLDNAVLWAKFGNGIKSQKYLDASKDICDSLEDC